MERSTWTDARLDDRFDQIDRRFDRIESDIRDLRGEVRAGFADLHSLIVRSNVTLMAGMLGLIAAILVRGA